MGAIRKWTLKMCLESTIGFNTITEWKKNNGGAYKAALSYGWKEECIKNFDSKKWTKEKVFADALKYDRPSDWVKNSRQANSVALKNGWKEEIIKTIFIPKNKKLVVSKNKGHWNIESCKEEALKYENKRQWRNGSGSSYAAALKKGWLVECCAHMTKLQKQSPAGTWTKEKCLLEASKYNRPSDWNKNSGGSYSSAMKKGWLNECCAHMTIRKTKPDRFWWDKNNCITDALKYKSKTEWFENNATAYAASKKIGCFNECVIPYYGYIEMDLVQTYHNLNEEIKTYSNLKEWLKKNKESYKLAKKLDLYYVLIDNFNLIDDKFVYNFTEFKNKMLKLIDFDIHSESKAKPTFKRDMKIKTSELILLCNNLIKGSYE
jgi:hypothetical protein